MSTPITSLHIYAEEPHDALLVKTLWPIVFQLKESNQIDGAFFIRYFGDEGPHIRLRIIGQPSDLLLREITDKIRENDEAISVKREKFDDKDLKLRFGGDYGASIALQQFRFSSEVIWGVMSENLEAWSYESALAVSLQMQLVMAGSFGLTLEEMKVFFKKSYIYWLPFSFKQQKTEELVGLFEKTFLSQKNNFLKVVKQAFDENNPWSSWKKGNSLVGGQLKMLIDQEYIESIPNKYLLPELGSKENALFHSFLAQLIHLHNNRMGIYNHDEPYLAYILHRVLEDVVG